MPRSLSKPTKTGIPVPAPLLLLGMAVLLVACGGDPAPGPTPATHKLKVVLLAQGMTNDGAWNQAAADAVRRLEREGRIEATIRERNNDPAAIEPVVRDYATRGYDLVITNGYEAIEPVLKLAKDFPKVHFAINGGTEVLQMTAPNVEAWTLDLRQWGYLCGFVAGRIGGVRTVGLVSGPQVPFIEEIHTAFKAGLKDTDPSRTWKEAYTGSFDDTQKAKEAAEALIGQGAQLIFTTGDGIGYGVGAAAAGHQPKVLTIGVAGGTAKQVNILNVKVDDYPEYKSYVDRIEAGTFGSKAYTATFPNKGLVLTPPEEGVTDPRIPADLRAQIDKLIADLASGARKIPTP
ncbi:MAG TPA: BMP family protein [Micromonosporaceae bacterium]|nr:BMP family protein [Micromonosporaceae bacterium]